MKIMVQDRNMIVDTTNADIYLNTDGEYHYVKLARGKQEFELGKYPEYDKAFAELSTIFSYIRIKKDTYYMSI